jgi:chromosome segregation ATPase
VDLLEKSNSDLQVRITTATSQYNDIVTKLKQKAAEEDENSLTQKIKELEKEILANNSEVEYYRRSIDSLKNKIDFKINLERAINLENILKAEIKKKAELQKELESLTKHNVVQIKAISNYDKENRFSEKIKILQDEIKITKQSLKTYQDKYSKQDRYIKQVHSKISSLENMIKKMSIPKIEVQKAFTKEELRETLEFLNQLKNQIRDNRQILKNISKINDDKLNNFMNINKQIEIDYKENDKVINTKLFSPDE